MTLARLAYFVRRTAQSLRQSLMVQTVAISTIAIAMLVLGAFLLLLKNLDQMADRWAAEARLVAFLSEDMTRLAEAHRLARRTARIVRQNLTFAIGAMLVLVIGGLFFDLPLPLAVIGHEGGTLLVVLNGLRLLSDPIRADRKPARA